MMVTMQHINESILSEEILEDQKKNRIDHMTYLAGNGEISARKCWIRLFQKLCKLTTTIITRRQM